MISIKANYLKIESKNPHLGGYSCLCQVVKYRKFSRKSLVKALKELVLEEEYAKDESKELIDYLEYLTNIPEEGEILGKNALGATK